MSALPATMRIIDVPAPGGPEALVIAERPVPQPGPAQVLIEVAAAGINRPDVLQRRGRYAPPAGAPTYPGLEVAGIVAALGPGVHEFAVGDRVCALLQGGGYAEYCVADEGQMLAVPASLDMVGAASLPETYFTVWGNVFEFGRLRAGETLLVHGGSSGIGVAAIQLAAARGHTVFATAGTDEKCRLCQELGATRAIHYKNEDFVAVVAAETAGRGVDVILDMVGGSYLARNLETLAVEGRLVCIGTQGGIKGEADVSRIMQRRLVITGSTLRPRSGEFKHSLRDKVREHVWPLLASGRIRPIIDKVFALEEAAQAHAYMESGVHKGKIVLQL